MTSYVPSSRKSRTEPKSTVFQRHQSSTSSNTKDEQVFSQDQTRPKKNQTSFDPISTDYDNDDANHRKLEYTEDTATRTETECQSPHDERFQNSFARKFLEGI